jgi:hypothetical protein
MAANAYKRAVEEMEGSISRSIVSCVWGPLKLGEQELIVGCMTGRAIPSYGLGADWEALLVLA